MRSCGPTVASDPPNAVSSRTVHPVERHLATIWESVADATPDGAALVQGGVRHTWREFDDRAARLARAFTDVGVSPGSKVALYLYNGPEYLES